MPSELYLSNIVRAHAISRNYLQGLKIEQGSIRPHRDRADARKCLRRERFSLV